MDSTSLEVAHIIGGGYSASQMNFKYIPKSHFIIGVNDSFFQTRCNMVVSIDGRWMLNRFEKLKELNAHAFLRKCSYEKHVGDVTWDNLELAECQVWENGLPESAKEMKGNNSGIVALHLAYLLGFNTIFLYGFDMGFDNKKHWYPEYEWKAKGNHMYPEFINQFKITASELEEKNITVYNVSPSSAMTCFERIDYGTAKNIFQRIP